MSIIQASIRHLNHELFIKGKKDWEVSIDDDGQVKLWYSNTGSLLRTFSDFDEAISAIQRIGT